MEDFVPVDTGALRDSIRTDISRDELTAEIGPGDEIDYALAVEYGTSDTPSQPYATPAAESARRRFPRAVKEHVRREVLP
jgi:hypothetical protein